MWALIFVLPAAFWYLGSRAIITRWLWSIYPTAFARFMDCAACVGFWWGAVIMAFSLWWGSNIPCFASGNPAQVLVAGWISMITTPLVASLHDLALTQLGSAVDDDDDAEG